MNALPRYRVSQREKTGVKDVIKDDKVHAERKKRPLNRTLCPTTVFNASLLEAGGGGGDEGLLHPDALVIVNSFASGARQRSVNSVAEKLQLKKDVFLCVVSIDGRGPAGPKVERPTFFRQRIASISSLFCLFVSAHNNVTTRRRRRRRGRPT